MTTPITPQVAQPSSNSVSYNTPMHDENPKLHSDWQSIDSNHSSSPESRPLDLKSPIPEEEEDETSSEAATNEPVTPTDNHQPHAFQDRMNISIKPDEEHPHAFGTIQPPPLILNTQATPPPSASKKDASPTTEQSIPKTPILRRPGSSKDSVKRAMSGFFKRSNSHSANTDIVPLAQADGNAPGNCSDSNLSKEHRQLSMKLSANTTPDTTRSNTPPPPTSPADKETAKRQKHLQVQEPLADDIFKQKKNRSSTGFNLRDKISKHKISFTHPEKETPYDRQRLRATSVDLDSPFPGSQDESGGKLPERSIWALPAETGIGLKSRRMSLSLPDDFTVDVADLYSEFSDQSKLVGRRGKSIGKGATSKVKLMNRKGCSGEVYAVKEFRGKSSNEKTEDYEQKVKSEYSIAKSVHHPNIVETFRLCTHNGRWNHVMEYCDQGDLFGLVSQKYLSRPDRQIDRLCLFKQLVQGLNYLHSNGIAHRDVKLENLLITKDSKLKITDFGVSEVFCGIHPGLRSAGGQCGKEMGEVRLCAPGMCGSAPYVAPEVLQKNVLGEYDPRPLDVWGAAVVMLTICSNGCLWTEARDGSSPLYDDLIRGWRKWNDKHAEGSSLGITETDYPHVGFFDQHINPPALRRILLTMLNPDPSKRASMSTVANNRWLKKVECCQIDSYEDPAVVIDASRIRSCGKTPTKVVQHNHLPISHTFGHKLVRLPGSTDMH
ncbi:Serine/threonine-protein kinase HAL4/SAT4 [Lachnellula arida]|uniref:Serine/threonine-protein kinase HAL4/SAT4 n=1 Tax=Lachnellula arida TaxID=1316785 RepID=A0A8T9B282_9HELO|nr:Serine/threonine-protein kinase HAL4/SAT4 [Lachnellula arida]